MLSTLNEQDLMKVFNTFLMLSNCKAEKYSKMISFKCYESTYICNSKQANGYGRQEKEANLNCIRNLLELLLEDDSLIKYFKESIRRVQSNQLSVTTPEVSQNIKAIHKPQNLDIDPNISINLSVNKEYKNLISHMHQNSQYEFGIDNSEKQSIHNKSINNSSYQNNLQNISQDFLQQPHQKSQNFILPDENSFQNSINDEHFYNAKNDKSFTANNAEKQKLNNQKHNRNKTMMQQSNNQNSQNNILKQISQNTICNQENNNYHNQSTKNLQAEEELKRAKNYIEHLERKVKLVMEENKILKSLLLENKKPLKQEQLNPQKENIQINPQHSQEKLRIQQNFSKGPKKENFGPYLQQQYKIQQNEVTKSMNLQQGELEQNVNIQEFLGLQNLNQLPDNLKLQDLDDENKSKNWFLNQNIIERSLSMDINGHINLKKNVQNDNRLDTSMYEQGSKQNNPSRKSIPKLNLAVLPNYHGKQNGKTMNSMMLAKYQQNHKNAKIPDMDAENDTELDTQH